MKLNELEVKLDLNAVMPTRAHSTDAGLDLYAKKTMVRITTDEGKFDYIPERNMIMPHSSLILDTGVHVNIPEGYVGFLKSKSGLNVKEGIISTGVIDAGYTGPIVVKLYNLSDDVIFINGGQKITQLVILPIETPTLKEVEFFTDIASSTRGDAGFGSTGK